MTRAARRAEAHESALAVVTRRVSATLPQLTEEEVLVHLATARAATGIPLRELADHLTGQPEALTSGDSRCPVALIRLAHVLHDAGFTAVVRPVCSDCNRPAINLRNAESGGRVCPRCAARANRGECARCGRSNIRIAARRPEGRICYGCYGTDPEVTEPCSGCGQSRRPTTRRTDGSPLCHSCWQPPSHPCSVCGNHGPAKTSGPDGAVCHDCYDRHRRPQRACGRCGHVRPVSKRAVGDGVDLCASCDRGPDQTCSRCSRLRPCRRRGPDRAWVCTACRHHIPDFCCRCGQFRPAQARWPIGPVCKSCYDTILNAPGQCSRCQAVAPLLGLDQNNEPICG